MSRELQRIGEQVRVVKAARKRVSSQLRIQTGRAASRSMTAGMTLGAVASVVGIRPATLRGWMGEASEHKRVLPVKVTSPDGPVEMTILGPCGLRIEGASVEQVVTLWRRLS